MIVEKVDNSLAMCEYVTAELITHYGYGSRAITNRHIRYVDTILDKAREAIKHCHTVEIVLYGSNRNFRDKYYFAVNDKYTEQDNLNYYYNNSELLQIAF